MVPDSRAIAWYQSNNRQKKTRGKRHHRKAKLGIECGVMPGRNLLGCKFSCASDMLDLRVVVLRRRSKADNSAAPRQSA